MGDPTVILGWAAAGGWITAALLYGLWLGERRTRILMHNMRTFGTPAPGKASVFMPGLEPAGPKLVASEDAEAMQWSEETVEKGVRELQAMYEQEGVPITEKEAREQVELMLNSSDGTMT